MKLKRKPATIAAITHFIFAAYVVSWIFFEVIEPGAFKWWKPPSFIVTLAYIYFSLLGIVFCATEIEK